MSRGRTLRHLFEIKKYNNNTPSRIIEYLLVRKKITLRMSRSSIRVRREESFIIFSLHEWSSSMHSHSWPAPSRRARAAPPPSPTTPFQQQPRMLQPLLTCLLVVFVFFFFVTQRLQSLLKHLARLLARDLFAIECRTHEYWEDILLWWFCPKNYIGRKNEKSVIPLQKSFMEKRESPQYLNLQRS